MARAQRVLERLSAQIEITVLKAFFLARIELVDDLEGRRVALVEDAEFDDVDLDRARGEFRVHVSAAALHNAANADNPLGTQRLRLLVGQLRLVAVALQVGIEDELRGAFAVP